MSAFASRNDVEKITLIEQTHCRWATVLFLLFGVAASLPQMTRAADQAAEEIPEGTCILELNLPNGATVKVDNRDYGTKRRLTYSDLQSGKTYGATVDVQFADGSTERTSVLIESGTTVRLVLAEIGRASCRERV